MTAEEALKEIVHYIELNKESQRDDDFQKGFMLLGDYILQIASKVNLDIPDEKWCKRWLVTYHDDTTDIIVADNISQLFRQLDTKKFKDVKMIR
jgi:hypothetical protein